MNIRLGAVRHVGIMQSDDLCTKQIVAWREVRRDSDATELTTSINHIVSAPLAAGGIVPLLPDLEPDVPSPCIRLGHVHHAGSLMCSCQDFIAWVIVPPLKAYSRAGCYPDLPVCWSCGLREKPTNHVIGIDAIGPHSNISNRIILIAAAMRTKSISRR